MIKQDASNQDQGVWLTPFPVISLGGGGHDTTLLLSRKSIIGAQNMPLSFS